MHEMSSEAFQKGGTSFYIFNSGINAIRNTTSLKEIMVHYLNRVELSLEVNSKILDWMQFQAVAFTNLILNCCQGVLLDEGFLNLECFWMCSKSTQTKAFLLALVSCSF